MVSDPLASLASPSTSGVTNYGSESVSGNSAATIKPGIYSQISVSGNGSLTMNSGLYIIEGGGFGVSGNGNVKGSGVTIFNAGSNYPGTGGSYGSITISGNGSFNLSAPTTGTYAGIVIFQSRDNTKTVTLSGNASGMSGIVYAPAAQLAESGNAQLNASAIVDTLSASGNSIEDTATLDSPAGKVALTPAQIPPAYGISNLTMDGTGQTIAIVGSAADSPFEITGGTNLSAPAWAGLLAPVNQAHGGKTAQLLNSASPTETQQAIHSGPESDYNQIDSGSNGYDAGSGYNLVTGLGTPVANLLVSDLAAYQGHARTYAGPTVGPLQSPSAQMTKTSLSSAGRSPKAASPQPILSSTADEALSDGASFRRLVVRLNRQIVLAPDWVLDDLVADLVDSRGKELGRTITVSEGSTPGMMGDRPEHRLACSIGPDLAGVPAGPIARRERPGQSTRSEARLEDLLLVGGFCGLGAGQLAAGNPRSGRVTMKRPFLELSKNRLPCGIRKREHSNPEPEGR